MPRTKVFQLFQSLCDNSFASNQPKISPSQASAKFPGINQKRPAPLIKYLPNKNAKHKPVSSPTDCIYRFSASFGSIISFNYSLKHRYNMLNETNDYPGKHAP